MKVLLKIAYLGTNYAGFQTQRGSSHQTVQAVLTEAVSAALGTPCTVTGCSRTDSGVHARGFCAVIESLAGEITTPLDKIPIAVNHKLPDDISILNCAPVPEDFHPRYGVVSKEYVYVFYDNALRDPFLEGRSMKLRVALSASDVAAMNEAASAFVGTHDFASFMAQGSKIKDTVRTVLSASVARVGSTVEFRVAADGFLYNMVRIMAGTLLSVAYGKYKPSDIVAVIKKKDRTCAGATAPACGLYLERAEYAIPIYWVL